MRRVLRQLVDQRVVEAVRVGTKFGLTFQQHHRRGVGIELLEVLADVQHRDRRRSILGGHRDRVRRTDLLQLRRNDIDHNGQRDPTQDDRHRQQPDGAGNERASGRLRRRAVAAGHADFTTQAVCAW